MAEDHIRYDILAQEALRGVMRKVLAEVARTGLPGNHHFFITFLTGAPGVRVSSRLHERYPELFAGWREDGPGKTWAALAARFARLAHAGHLEIDDPDLAARQFLALVNADLHVTSMLGEKPDEAQLKRSAENAVRTFLRAYGKRPAAAHGPEVLAQGANR